MTVHRFYAKLPSAKIINVPNYSEQKKQIRERILTLLRNQRKEERLSKSRLIQQKLFQIREFQKAGTILFYASFDGEVNTFEMIKQAQILKKRIGLPHTLRSRNEFIPVEIEDLEAHLEDGPYGTKQPAADPARTLTPKNIDVVIIPGVAFDKQRNRLGRGGGYYDRFLATLPTDTPKIGLAFDFQVVDHLPHQKHDIAMSYVLTN